MKFNVLLILLLSILSGCSSNLVQDTYEYTQNGTDEEVQTAFVILSNIALEQSELDKIKKDYKNETESSRKLLYEYLLAKRTQEKQYILSFIKSCTDNSSILLQNSSSWISIANPILELLFNSSTTNDDALGILLKLLLESDGANQTVIAANLKVAYELNPNRFIVITKKMKFDINSILLLLDDE